MEENNWKMSNQNKKSRSKRLFRQLKVFLISVLLFAVGVFVGLYFYNNNSGKINENTITSEKIENENIESKVYSIDNKDFYFQGEKEDEYSGIKLFEYDNTKSEYAEIYYRLDSYSTDPSYSYTIEVKNETGESLIINDIGKNISEAYIIGGVTSSLKINKEKDINKIEITVKEMLYHTSKNKTEERIARVTLDLNKDLKLQEKINFASNTENYELEDIKFKTYKDDKVLNDTYSMASPNCKMTAYSIGISTQYGNRIISEENIQFSALNNINNLNLDDAFNIETQISEKVGQYGLVDVYKIFITNDNGEITNEFEITFDDMKNLIDGKNININGKTITSKDISNGEENLKLKDSSKITLKNGIQAIKYNFENSDKTNYMFIIKGYIYYIEVPNGEKYKENVDLFLDSLTEK